MMKKRKIPLRICIGCQEKKQKKEMIRVVRTPEGAITIDLTGKRAGRGVYICPDQSCLKKAVKGRRLEKNLQHPLPDNLVDEIAAMLESDL